MSQSAPFIAAAVQAPPVYLDAPRTIERVGALTHEAAANGAALVAFPEVFVAGYPYWNWVMNPVEGGTWFERLYDCAIAVPGPECESLAAIARSAAVHLVVGVNERAPQSVGTLYNTLLTFGPDGTLLGHHRKLVPTWAEKLTWGHGDGASLQVHETAIGPLGALACGENTNPLARYALLAQGELIHVSAYIALPVGPADYDMAEAIRLRSCAQSFEGKIFTIVACSTVSEEIVTVIAGDDPERAKLLRRPHCALSGIFGPDGRPLSDPLIDVEGIVYGEIDVRRCISARQMHDVVGHYNRFDVFRLALDTTRHVALTFADHAPQSHGRVAETPTVHDSPANEKEVIDG